MRESSASGQPLPLVSLIIVTYNSAALIPALFASLATTQYTPYEVVVVDNASTDGTLAYLAREQPQVRVLSNSTNLGFGRACNQGVRAAQGAFFVFLNPDIVVTPAWLSILVRHIGAEPGTAIICPTTLHPGQQARLQTDQPAFEAVAAVPGSAMMLSRTAWEALEGFDEQIFLYWEDTELCWRAWLLGWRVLVDHTAIVVHKRGGSGGGRAWETEAMRNSLYVYLKLMRWRQIIPFAMLLLLKTVAKIAVGRQGLHAAWIWNFKHLGHTLAQRRELQQKRRIDPRLLELLIEQHTQTQKRHRRAGAITSYE